MVWADLSVIILYLILLLIIGGIVSKKVKTHEDSVVGGRSFGAFFAAVGKAANLAGGPSTVGGAGYGYTYGVSGSWFAIANVISTTVWSPFTPRFWRAMSRGGFTSIGDYLGYRYGKFARIFAGLLNSLAYMGFVAAQIIATGTILAVLLGWNPKVAMLVTTLIVIIYTILGGLKAVVYTDLLQLGILYVGLVLILPALAVGKAGGMEQLFAALPEAFQQIGAMGWPRIIGVIVAPTILMPFAMQASYIYTASCKSSKAAWQSNLLTGVFYGLPALCSVFVGLAAFVLFPGLASAQDAMPTVIIEFLPHGAIGLMIAAILSATMSTSSTCLLCSTNCFITDVMNAVSTKTRTGEEQLKVTRIGIGVIGLLTLCITLFYSDIIAIITLGYAMGVGGLLAPAMGAMFWKRATTAGCVTAMIVGGGSYLVIQLGQLATWPPLFFSFPVSLLLLIVVSLFTKPSNPLMYDVYFEDEWAKSPNNPENASNVTA
ncbi:MAG: sodium:solute symporter family protein [Clostridiales Family XIII bacterium]|jgi:SSS family solute:Na+ symporter|nr:sodium:solute symporter family protein [Clostridiales Family XIII bacterium]